MKTKLRQQCINIFLYFNTIDVFIITYKFTLSIVAMFLITLFLFT